MRRALALGDPGFLGKPGMIGVADRATGAREKHRAASKAFAIGLDAGGDRASGLRAFDHDHSHVNLPWKLVLKQNAGRLDLRLLSVRILLGGIAHLCLIEHGVAWGSLLVTGLIPTGRVPSWTLDMNRWSL